MTAGPAEKSPGRMCFFWIALILGFVGATAWGPELPTRVRQPLAFDHRIHLEEAELECQGCHTTVADRPYASIPSISLCLECHEEPLTDRPEEARLLAYAEEPRREIPWVRLFRQPGHVYYSHRTHVGIAEIPCRTCHGDFGERAGSETRPPANLTMEDCIACHRQSSARNDCTACHR